MRRRAIRAGCVAVAAVIVYYLVVREVIRQLGEGELDHVLIPLVALGVPLAALTAVPLALLTRRSLSWPSRVLLSLSIAWLLFIAVEGIAGSWVSALLNLMPPMALPVVPGVLLVVAVLLRLRGVLGSAGEIRWLAVLTGTALVAGIASPGVRVAALWTHDGGTSGRPLRVVSWDTFAWDTRTAPDRLFGFLRQQHADVYLLQDYMAGTADAPQPPGDASRLRQEFPGYRLASSGQLLTISRFPILAQEPLNTGRGRGPVPFGAAWPGFWTYRALRTDVQVGDTVMSLYNVHFFDLFSAENSPLTPRFYSIMQELGSRRRQQFRTLSADLARNHRTALVSGNFNTLPNMPDIKRLGLKDASTSFYPTSLSFLGRTLWRVDWTFTTAGVAVQSYRLHNPHQMSPHDLQEIVVSLRR